MFEAICKITPGCQPAVLEQTIQLAVEIAREGREGRKIGTMFIVGDEEHVLKESRPLILDPLQGHSLEVKSISSHTSMALKMICRSRKWHSKSARSTPHQ